MRARDPQLQLDLPAPFGWGGARQGSGRRPSGARAEQRHGRRSPFAARFPVHVTLRVRSGVWNLRTRRCYARVALALRALAGRADARVVHFSVQGNHLHLLAEADGALALGRAMRILSIRLSRGLNALMQTRGRVLEGRYHAHVLRTPLEARRALAYVVGNFASHAARRGAPLPADYVDPFSSAAAICPDGLPPPVSRPRTWLLAAAEAAAAARPSPPAGEEVAPYAAAA